MTNKTNEWIKGKMKELRMARGGRCEKILDNFQRCTSKRQLEFHHIAETNVLGIPKHNHRAGRGRKERYYDIRNNPDSYKLLCIKHHKEAHNIS
ncbi:MAG: hypothetical protein WED05_10070 [Candidatus Atabeyarchaeum deiterrae]